MSTEDILQSQFITRYVIDFAIWLGQWAHSCNLPITMEVDKLRFYTNFSRQWCSVVHDSGNVTKVSLKSLRLVLLHPITLIASKQIVCIH